MAVDTVLYKQNNSGKIQQWMVTVSENIVTTQYGQFNGKIQSTNETIKGKNLGKSNETSDVEQAIIKATQLFEKKLKEGYTPDLELAKSTTNTLDGVKPMLAHPIEKKEKAVVFPAIAQPKLDGMRCLAVVSNGNCVLYTRSQKVISTLPHLNAEINAACLKHGITDIVIDGELYNHEDKDNFNKLMSLIKRDNPHEDCAHIQYHVYDVVNDENYFERSKLLDYFIHACEHVMSVDTVVVNSREELETFFHGALKNGYEGAMYRNPNIGYENKRSVSLLKVKVMQDAEFQIIGVQEGKGKLEGHAGAFICHVGVGEELKEFKAKLKGKTEDLIEYFVNFDKYKGRRLTVQFQGFTPDGIPRFPVGLRIREEE